MHNTTKFGIVSLLLLSVAPAQAVTASRQLSVNGFVEAKYNYDTGDQQRKVFSYSKTDPNPTAGGVYSDFLYQNKASTYYAYCINYGFSSCLQAHYAKSFVSSLSTVDIGAGSIKAKSVNYIDMETPWDGNLGTIAENNLTASSYDKITFNGIAPGTQAVLKITNYAAVKTSQDNVLTDPWAQSWRSSSMSYTSTTLIYDNLAAVSSETLGPKFLSQWQVCNNSAIINACGANTIFNGYRSSSNFYLVDSDDILFIQNSLALENRIDVKYNVVGNGNRRIWKQTNDFGNSGYTLIEMLTPGTGYESEFGSLYPTTAPAFVPEPASWAMLIAGFGLTGGAMRRRRQRPHTVAA